MNNRKEPALFDRAVIAKKTLENALRMASPVVQKARDNGRDAAQKQSFDLDRLRQRVDAIDRRITPHLRTN